MVFFKYNFYNENKQTLGKLFFFCFMVKNGKKRNYKIKGDLYSSY